MGGTEGGETREESEQRERERETEREREKPMITTSSGCIQWLQNYKSLVSSV